MDWPERSILVRYSGASPLFSDPGAAGVIARAAFFGPVGVPALEYLYIGPSPRSSRYLGAKTDAEIYLGAKLLFPTETVTLLELYGGGTLELYGGGSLELYPARAALALYGGGNLELYGGGSLELYD